jgi:hypothetical protein
MKLSDVLIGIIVLAMPGLSLAADNWRGQATGGRMTLATGVYDVYTVNGLALTPSGLEADPGFYGSAKALLGSLNSLFDANVGYLDAGMEIRGNDADAALFLADAGLRWQPSRKLGVGLSYAMFQSDSEYSKNSSSTDLDLDSVGPHLTLNIAF